MDMVHYWIVDNGHWVVRNRLMDVWEGFFANTLAISTSSGDKTFSSLSLPLSGQKRKMNTAFKCTPCYYLHNTVCS